jgi:vacuolar-type H+-ATPase subunit F/Vma7
LSRLIVITRPTLLNGFLLAGVEAHAPDDVETAQELIDGFLASGEVELLAIDDGLMNSMDANFLQRLRSAENIYIIAIPGGEPLGPEATRRYRIAEIARRAIGFSAMFREEREEEASE